MCEHPLFRMWKDRLDAEMARERERTARRAQREQERGAWLAAWRAYKAEATGRYQPAPRPPWWNLWGWVRWLLSLHAPGRPD